MNFLLNFLNPIIARIIDGFKLNSPTAFVVVQSVLLAVWFFLDSLIKSGDLVAKIVTIPVVGAVDLVDLASKVIVFLLAAFGVHTSELLKALNAPKSKEIGEDK